MTETADGLVIKPQPLHAGVFGSYSDHRLAHAAAVLGLAVPGIEVDDIGSTAKTMPDFADRWLSMLGADPGPAPTPGPVPNAPAGGAR